MFPTYRVPLCYNIYLRLVCLNQVKLPLAHPTRGKKCAQKTVLNFNYECQNMRWAARLQIGKHYSDILVDAVIEDTYGKDLYHKQENHV